MSGDRTAEPGSWGDLFERASEYDVSEADVREALAARREARDE